MDLRVQQVSLLLKYSTLPKLLIYNINWRLCVTKEHLPNNIMISIMIKKNERTVVRTLLLLLLLLLYYFYSGTPLNKRPNM